jgi:hypothetical protein
VNGELRVEVRTTEWPGWLALVLALGCVGWMAWERESRKIHNFDISPHQASSTVAQAPLTPIQAVRPAPTPEVAPPEPAQKHESPDELLARIAKAAAPWDRPCPRCGSRGPDHRDEPVRFRSDGLPFPHSP